METGETLVLLLLFVPALASVLALVLRGSKGIAVIVVANALALMAVSLVLLFYMSWNSLPTIAIDSEAFFPMSWAVLALDFALMITFIALGARDRSWSVVLLALAQLVPLAWFELGGRGGETEPAMLVDMLSVELILVTSFVGSLICVYALKYMEHDGNRSRFFAILLDNSTSRLTRDRMVSFPLATGVVLVALNLILVAYLFPEVGW